MVTRDGVPVVDSLVTPHHSHNTTTATTHDGARHSVSAGRRGGTPADLLSPPPQLSLYLQPETAKQLHEQGECLAPQQICRLSLSIWRRAKVKLSGWHSTRVSTAFLLALFTDVSNCSCKVNPDSVNYVDRYKVDSMCAVMEVCTECVAVFNSSWKKVFVWDCKTKSSESENQLGLSASELHNTFKGFVYNGGNIEVSQIEVLIISSLAHWEPDLRIWLSLFVVPWKTTPTQ